MNGPAPVAVTLNVAVWPRLTVWLVGCVVIVGPPPVPVKLAACALPVALSVTTRLPVRVPLLLGVKVTYMVHVEPAATPFPQLSVSAKSPVVAMLAICTGAVPLLVSVTVWDGLVVPAAWLLKVRLDGERATAGEREKLDTKASA